MSHLRFKEEKERGFDILTHGNLPPKGQSGESRSDEPSLWDNLKRSSLAKDKLDQMDRLEEQQRRAST